MEVTELAHAAVRGSAEISEEMFGRPSELSKDDLHRLLKVVRTAGVSLESWWTHGKPAIDTINGVLHVKPEIAGNIVRELVTLQGARLRLDVFPLGIINPELIQINISTPGAAH